MTQDENQATQEAGEEITEGTAAGVAAAEEQNEGRAEPTEIETLATDMGWSPEDAWRGDPDKWVDAETFIRQGPEILKSTLRTQDEKLDTQGKQLLEVRDNVARMTKVAESVEQRAYDKALGDLKTKQRSAAEDVDMDAYDKVSEDIEKLEKPQEAKAGDTDSTAATPTDDPNYRAFAEANPWYQDNMEMGAYADQIASRVSAKVGGGKPFYEAIGKAVREKFPGHFGNPARRGKAKVEGAGGSGARQSNGAKSYRDLPADAKAVCDRYVADGTTTKEDYCKIYYAEDAA